VRAVRVTAVVGAAVGGLGPVEVSALLEQDPEVVRAVRVTAPAGSAVGGLGLFELSALREHGAPRGGRGNGEGEAVSCPRGARLRRFARVAAQAATRTAHRRRGPRGVVASSGRRLAWTRGPVHGAAAKPSAAGSPRRLVYADPPYPGLAARHYGQQDNLCRGGRPRPARSVAGRRGGRVGALDVGGRARRRLVAAAGIDGWRVCAWCKPRPSYADRSLGIPHAGSR
jgi:hypothetical protein